MSMKRLVRVLTAAAFVTAVAGRVSAAPIPFDNGAPNQVDGFSLSDFSEADDFVLTQLSAVTDFHFWNLQGSEADYLGSITWTIFANNGSAPGAMLATGAATPTRTATGNAVAGFAEVANDFNVPAILLGAGRYWLGLHDGPLSATDFLDFYWETTNPNGTFSSSGLDLVGGGGWQPNSAQLAFNVTGVPVPEPTSLVLMSTAVALLARRRKRRT